jgi:hypothetical protein
MTDRLIAVDGAPPVGEPYRLVDSPLGKGFLAPYIAFDAQERKLLADARNRSIKTGLMLMGLIIPGMSLATTSSMYTHRTPYTDALDQLQTAERLGLVPPGHTVYTTAGIINGNIEAVILYLPED